MKYNQPFDQPGNPAASFVDGNPAAGINGSIPPAAALEYPQREIVNFITAMGITPDNGDLSQLLKSAAILAGSIYFQDTGTADALAVTLPSYMSLRPGLTFRIRKGPNPNDGAMTLVVNTAGATGPGVTIPVQWPDGSQLAGNDWRGNAVGVGVYDGAVVQMTGIGKPSVSDLVYYGVAAGTNALTATLEPALPAGTTVLPDGMLILLMPAAANTGAATLDPNGIGVNIPIVYWDGSALAGGDMQPNMPAMLIAKSGNLILTNPRGQHGAAILLVGSGNFTVPPGVWWLEWTDGWSGASQGGGASNAGSGSGGWGGTYAIKYRIPVTPGQVIPYTVGNGGSTSVGATPGQPGGATSFGSIFTCPGPPGGNPGISTTANFSTAPSLPTGGDLNLIGPTPGNGELFGSLYVGGAGGAAPLGGVSAGAGSTGTSPALGNTGFPAAGGLGAGAASGATWSGGPGQPGMIRVKW